MEFGLNNDVGSSKPASAGMDTTEATQDIDTFVSQCGKKRCKTCRHIVEGDGFCIATQQTKNTPLSHVRL